MSEGMLPKLSAARECDIALCLSGGGFRATFFQLGVIAALKHKKQLDRVTHICSVSGGSVLAAHLVLNWDWYCGSDADHAVVQSELIRFGQRDVRGRVIRRWLLGHLLFPARAAFWLARWFFPERVPAWFARRTSLLQREYDRLFFGAALRDLASGSSWRHPDLKDRQGPGRKRPDLHILCTCLTTGELYAFSHDGVSISGSSGQRHYPLGSAPLAYAVAASSAFPPLFPPVEVTRDQLGADEGEMQHATDYLSDGGIFDNLGVRRLVSLLTEKGVGWESVLIVDAGASLDWNTKGRFAWVTSRTARSIDIMMHLLAEATLRLARPEELGGSVHRLAVSDELKGSPLTTLPAEYRKRSKRIRTDLDKFSQPVVEVLMQHGFEACLNRGPPSPDANPSQGPIATAKTITRSPSTRVEKVLDRARRRSLGLFATDDPAAYALWIAMALLVMVGAVGYAGFPVLLYAFRQQEIAVREQEIAATTESDVRRQENRLALSLEEGPKTLTLAYMSEFRSYFGQLSLERFDPEAVLVLGATNAMPGDAAYGLNAYPPRELWPNIERTMIVLDEFLKRYGGQVEITSAYRTPAYSRAIAGAPESVHLLFYAVDFKVDRGDPAEWAEILREIRASGLFRGGIGQYETFIHLDTRGPRNRTWAQ